MFKPVRPAAPAAVALVELAPEDVDTVRAGRVAWQRIRGQEAGTVAGWKAIGHAIQVGRRYAEAHRGRVGSFERATGA
jgi:hypothetical protein